MSTEPLLTISAFARAVDLAPSALRYYDDAGLLPPAEVDARTGYRYYTPELARRAHLIRRMRAVGVPVETMRAVLDSDPEEAVQLLRDFAAQAAQSAERTAVTIEDLVADLHRGDDPGEPVTVSLDGPELATALTQVSRAAGTETGSPLRGVLVDIDGAGVTVVATNRYWLAAWSLTTTAVESARGTRLFLPLDDVSPLAQWLSWQGAVRIHAENTAATVSGRGRDGGACPTRTITPGADRFPAYQLILDAQDDRHARTTMPRQALLDACAPAEDGVRLHVGPDRVTVSTDDASEGRHLAARTVGAPFTLALSVDLFRPAVEMMVGNQVSLEYSADTRPLWVTSPGQRRLRALVMPRRYAG